MKTLIVCCIHLMFFSIIYGQSQIDSLLHLKKSIEPTKQYLIYQYRIPEWGYQRLYFDFSGTNSGLDYFSDDKARKENTYNAVFSPNYYNYFESEKMISSFNSNLRLNYWNYKYKRTDSNNTQEYKSIDKDIYFRLNGDMNKYLNDNVFLKFYSSNIFRYSEDKDFEEYQNLETTRSSFYRQYQTSFRFGFGYGRKRNVNPVFRAIRFNERLKSVSELNNLSKKELENLTELYTRKTAYNVIYDRPSKYFYSALPKSISEKIKKLEPWEIHYLNEALSEIIGDRYEGYTINTGISLNYDRKYFSTQSNNSELFLLGGYLQQSYYHNFSPLYQLGVTFYGSYLNVLNSNTSLKYYGTGEVKILNLWNLTDRMLLEIDTGLETIFASSKEKMVGEDNRWKRQDKYFINIDFNYFIENNLSIYSNISYTYCKNKPENISFNYITNYYRSSYYEKEKNWNISFGIRYYLTQSLI